MDYKDTDNLPKTLFPMKASLEKLEQELLQRWEQEHIYQQLRQKYSMPRHEPRIPLRHMLDHAREAYALIQNKSREDLDADRLLNLALVRLLEIIGEAASRVSPEERAH